MRCNVFKTTGNIHKSVYSSGELLHADLIGPLNKTSALICIYHNSKFISIADIKVRSEITFFSILSIFSFFFHGAKQKNLHTGFCIYT